MFRRRPGSFSDQQTAPGLVGTIMPDDPEGHLYKSNSHTLVSFSVSISACGVVLNVNRAPARAFEMALGVYRTNEIEPSSVTRTDRTDTGGARRTRRRHGGTQPRFAHISSRCRGVRRHFMVFRSFTASFKTRGMKGGGPAILRCTVLLPPLRLV